MDSTIIDNWNVAYKVASSVFLCTEVSLRQFIGSGKPKQPRFYKKAQKMALKLRWKSLMSITYAQNCINVFLFKSYFKCVLTL